MKRLHELIGAENPLEVNARAMRDFAQAQQAAVVGAMHVTCSDECERECVEAFQHRFAEEMLPSLKYSEQSSFRTATLGGRYEWGSASLAEDHFRLPDDQDGTQLLLIKLNAHVAVTRDGGGLRYGTMDRYDVASQFCGALHAMLNGAQLPAVRDLAEAFRSEGVDRITMLNDPSQVDPHYRSLLAAVAGARLQARRAVLDIQDAPHPRDALILVLPCVTMNRPDHDTELLVGCYTADFRGGKSEIRYVGLGDDPSAYSVSLRRGVAVVSDGPAHEDRLARDYRQIVAQRWQEREGQVLIDDERLQEIVVLSERASPGAAISKEILKTLLRLLADVALVPTALLLFVEGVAGIHNIYRAYRLASGQGTRYDATSILDEILARVDALSPQQAGRVVAKLCASYGIPLEAADVDEAAASARESDVRTVDDRRDDLAGQGETAATDEAKTTFEPVVEPALAARVSGRAVADDDLGAAAELTMDLELGAGSPLQFTSLPEPEVEAPMSQPLTELSLESTVARVETPKIETAPARPVGDVSAAVETKAIVDETKEVTAIATPAIRHESMSIVDRTKDVTTIDTPPISSEVKPIVAGAAPIEAPVQPIEAAAPPIDTAAEAIKATARPIQIGQPNLGGAPLRQPHVVQPGASQPAPRPQSAGDDVVVEAELIPVEDETDDVLIIDDEYRLRG